MIIIKILVILLVLALLVLPYVPLRWPLSFSYYCAPNVRKRRNVVNLICIAAVVVLFIVLMPLIQGLVMKLGSLKFIRWILNKIPAYSRYATLLTVLILVNLLFNAVSLLVLFIVNKCGGLFSAIGRLIKKFFALFKKKDGEGKKEKPQKEKRKKDKKQNEPEKPRHSTGATPIAPGAVTDPQNTSETDPDEPEPEPEPQEVKTDLPLAEKCTEPMPAELLPEPEPMPETNRVLFPGSRIAGKNRAPKKAIPVRKKKNQTEKKKSLFTRLMDRIRGIALENKENKWFVRPQVHHTAEHLKYFLIIVGAVYLIAFALLLIPSLFHITVLEKPLYKAMRIIIGANYLYPALSLAVLFSMFYLMDGKTAPVDGKEAEEDLKMLQQGHIVDLDALEADLLKTYGKNFEVKSFYSSDVDPMYCERGTIDLSGNAFLTNVAEYVRSQNIEVNQEYLTGIKAFQNGSHVLFQAPLYTAVGAYILSALNARILQGERVVVIVRNRSEIPTLIQRLEESFIRINRTHKCLWKIVDSAHIRKDSDEDIIVLTPEEFRSEHLFSSHPGIFRQVTVALLPDSDVVVAANNYYCQVISERLRQFCAPGLQYIFLSTRSTLNLSNALIEFFMLTEAPVESRGDYGYGDIHIFVWKNRTDSSVILDAASNNMLLEVNICNVANAHGIPTPQVVSDGAIFPNQVDRQWLDIYDSDERPIGFLVVSDDKFNLPGVIHAYSRYIGKKASVLHVITKQYLLRDYFFAHAPRYLFEEPLMGKIMLEHAKQDKTRIILLLSKLMKGIPVSEFISEMRAIDGDDFVEPEGFGDISKLVDRCLTIALGHAPDDGQEHFNLYTPAKDFYPEQFIRVNEDYDVLNRLLEETELVRVVFRGARESAYINLFRRMLDQRYLAGQNLVYDYSNFFIEKIDHENGVLYVDDANNNHGIAHDYVQLRRYGISGTSFQNDCRAISEGRNPENASVYGKRLDFAGENNLVSGFVRVRSDSAFDVTSDTVGYYLIDCDGGQIDLKDQHLQVVRLYDKEQEELRRKVTGGVYLKLELKRERDDRLTMTLAVLLQEMMKTLFPDSYFCLSVCPILKNPDAIYNNPEFASRMIAQLYPRLENWGEVCDKSIELLIVDDCEGGTGAMNLLYEPEGTFLKNVFWMLSDYLEWQANSDTKSYLYFGTDAMPAIFDIEGIRQVLKNFAYSFVREHDVNINLNAEDLCDICGLKIDQPYLWHGTRTICERCANEYAPDEEECRRILAYAIDYLIDQFSVRIPEMFVKISDNLSGDQLSELDFEQRTIFLVKDLPLTAVHAQIIQQVVRYWQLLNLEIDGDPELEGQVRFVLLQYMRYLEQHQYAQSLHRKYLLGTDDPSVGYCSLVQNLQAEGHDNSFTYMLSRARRTGKNPIKPVTPKKSTHTGDENSVSYYYRSKLSPEDAKIYDLLLSTHMEHAEQADVSSFGISADHLDMIHDYMRCDHGEIFWSNFIYNYSFDQDGKVLTYSPAYTMTREERDRRAAELEAAIAEFTSGITAEMGDYEIALKLYERMIEKLDYDTIELERQSPDFDRSKYPDDIRTMYGALVEHKAVCSGYAKAYMTLLHRYGIEAMYAAGVCTKGGRHSWNVVKLEGDYYHIDTTWGDNSNTDSKLCSYRMTYLYFAVTDRVIMMSRTPDANMPLPACTSDGCNYYVRNNLFFTSYDQSVVAKTIADKAKDPACDLVELRFASTNLLETAVNYLFYNGGLREALRIAGREAKTSYISDREINLLRIFLDPK